MHGASNKNRDHPDRIENKIICTLTDASRVEAPRETKSKRACCWLMMMVGGGWGAGSGRRSGGSGGGRVGNGRGCQQRRVSLLASLSHGLAWVDATQIIFSRREAATGNQIPNLHPTPFRFPPFSKVVRSKYQAEKSSEYHPEKLRCHLLKRDS